MTDRTRSITVILDDAYRVDAIEATITAIRQIKGVIAAEPDVSDPTGFMALERARHELREVLWKAIEEHGRRDR